MFFFFFKRKYIISCKQTDVPVSVPWDPSNQVLHGRQTGTFLARLIGYCSQVQELKQPFVFQMYLSYNNVSALKLMDARTNWVLTSEKNNVSVVFGDRPGYGLLSRHSCCHSPVYSGAFGDFDFATVGRRSISQKMLQALLLYHRHPPGVYSRALGNETQRFSSKMCVVLLKYVGLLTAARI